MKLLLFCLFTVCCCALALRRDKSPPEKKLEETLRQLSEMKKSLKPSEQMLNTPPQNIQDCCCLSALNCFRSNLQLQFNVTGREAMRLYRSLKHPLTVKGLDFCNIGNRTASCQACDSHPKENATEFFNRLESLLQRAITKLSMN